MFEQPGNFIPSVATSREKLLGLSQWLARCIYRPNTIMGGLKNYTELAQYSFTKGTSVKRTTSFDSA